MKYLNLCVLLMGVLFGCQEGAKDTEKPEESTALDSGKQENKIKSMKADLLLDSKASLGEGALWNKKTQELYWIDIENGILHIYNPANQQDRVIKLGQKVGTVVPDESGNALVALEDGIYQIDLKTEKKRLLAKRPANEAADNRFNDGKCDPAGRFWVGTMSMKGVEKAGNFYVFDGNGKLTKTYDSVTVSNGVVWSLDSTKMYYIDTPTKEIKEFSYNNQTGEVALQKVAIAIPDGMGYPDGMTIDSEGMLWVGMWEGFAVTRWNPNNGELLMKVDVPVSRVTSCAFGGENLDTLYITTASVGASEDELRQYPNSGSLFAVKTGYTGIPNCFYQKAKKKKMSLGF
ncbi:MAG: SMP-30/gluconolactonase/LRE family protein [Cytophagales bacterium]|nr:MAG: SMP-30/gluconolactonase/LRE family protein [Cytophagales bacterium]